MQLLNMLLFCEDGDDNHCDGDCGCGCYYCCSATTASASATATAPAIAHHDHHHHYYYCCYYCCCYNHCTTATTTGTDAATTTTTTTTTTPTTTATTTTTTTTLLPQQQLLLVLLDCHVYKDEREHPEHAHTPNLQVPGVITHVHTHQTLNLEQDTPDSLYYSLRPNLPQPQPPLLPNAKHLNPRLKPYTIHTLSLAEKKHRRHESEAQKEARFHPEVPLPLGLPHPRSGLCLKCRRGRLDVLAG